MIRRTSAAPLHGFVRVHPSSIDTKVTLRAINGGVGDKVVLVTVGSPRHTRETIPPDATFGDGVHPVVRGLLLSSALDAAGQAEGDRRDGEAGALEVRNACFARDRQSDASSPSVQSS